MRLYDWFEGVVIEARNRVTDDFAFRYATKPRLIFI